MEQVPHWLEVTVFAAGMTAYAEEVDTKETAAKALPSHGGAEEIESPDSYH
jgi:hypothetical protein